MEILIRRRGEDGGGGAAAIERAVETDALGIGSAPERDLRLADAGVAERHAEIAIAGGTPEIVCRRGCSVLVDGVPSTRGTLAVGTVVGLGEHRIEVVAPPTGFDLALDVTRDAAAIAGAPPATFRGTRLADTWLAPRTTAWLLSAAVLLLALVVPLAHHALDTRERDPLADVVRSGPTVTAAPDGADGLDPETVADAAIAEAATGRDARAPSGGWTRLLGGDRLWSSGPLHDAHAALESDCGACHEKLFRRVTNASCERCHAGTNDHVSAAAAAANAGFHEPMNGRCAGCHEEHNEPSTLAHRSDALCADCHDDPALADARGPMTPVTAFGTGTHPDFDVTLPRPPREAPSAKTSPPVAASVDAAPGDGWTLERLPLEGARESSGLRFDHAAHAEGARMGRPDGEGLACADCHVRRPDGEHFEPIEFETDCATSGCHQLELDATHRIPHGQPDVAVAAIEGFYLRTFGSPDAERTSPTPRRRRPDRDASRVDERVDCDGSNFDCALALATRKVEQQFTRTGCVTCHVVEAAPAGASGADGARAVPFAIAEVRLVEDVHPAARFDHDSHDVLIEPGGRGAAVLGDAACLSCHEATASSSAEDLLMPSIDTCTACHDGPSRTANVPLGCVDCHEYHPASSSFQFGKDS